MYLWSALLFAVVAFFRKSLCASSSPSDRQSAGNELLTSSVNAQTSGNDLSSSGYFGIFSNTVSYMMDTGYSIADLITKRDARIDSVRHYEKKIFEETKPRGRFTDWVNCPPAFPEPAEWEVNRIKNISSVLASISDFEPKSIDLVELATPSHPKTTYIYYQSCNDYDLFALRPAIYPEVEDKTPELALRYHMFIDTLISSVFNKIGPKPKRQIVFAGAGEAGAMALILAWRIYLSNDHLVGCGYSSNALNQVAVVTFDTRSIVTQGRMENCPLGRHNILNFMSKDAAKLKDVHRGFDIGGYLIPLDSNPNFEHTASYPNEKILHYIEYPPDWKGKLDLNSNVAVNLARKLIANHHAITKHASQNAFSAFKEFGPNILVRDHEWCAEKMRNVLSLQTGLKEGMIGFEIVKDHENHVKNSPREVLFTLKSRSEGNKVIFANFSLEILKSGETSQIKVSPPIPISEMKISDRKKSKLEKWSRCIDDLFSMSTNLRSFSPNNYGSAAEFEYTAAKFPARCLFTNLNTASNLETAYTMDREAFYSIFSQILHREKPQSCEGQLRPPTIPDEDKGNRDAWLSLFKRFWGDVINLVKVHQNRETLQALGNIESTERFAVETISSPKDYIFPHSFANLVNEINKCLSKNLGSSMINCKHPDSLFAGINNGTGINQCPAACKYEMGNTAGCERVLPCPKAKGIFLMMRGKSMVDLPIINNDTRAAYMTSIPCEVDHGRTFHFMIMDKSKGLLNLQNQMYATICIDPIRVDSLIKWDPKMSTNKEPILPKNNATKEANTPKEKTLVTTTDIDFEGMDSNSDYSNEEDESKSESEEVRKEESKTESEGVVNVGDGTKLDSLEGKPDKTVEINSDPINNLDSKQDNPKPLVNLMEGNSNVHSIGEDNEGTKNPEKDQELSSSVPATESEQVNILKSELKKNLPPTENEKPNND